MTERGDNWEWTDICLPVLEFTHDGHEWMSNSRYSLSGCIGTVTREEGGWTCLIDKPTYVIGIHDREARILIMRDKKE